MGFNNRYMLVFEEALKELECKGSNYVGRVRSGCYSTGVDVTEEGKTRWLNPRMSLFVGSKPREKF